MGNQVSNSTRRNSLPPKIKLSATESKDSNISSDVGVTPNSSFMRISTAGSSLFSSKFLGSKYSPLASPSINSGSKDYPSYLLKLGNILEKKSLQEENSVGICVETFQKYLCKASKSLGKVLFDYFLLKENEQENFIDKHPPKLVLAADEFTHQANVLMGCVNDNRQLQYYISVFCESREEMTHDEFYSLVSASYEVAQFSHHSDCLPDNLLSAMSKAVMHGKERLTCNYIFNWVIQNCPRMVMWMHQYISYNLTNSHNTIPQNIISQADDNITPILDGIQSSSCASIHPALIWMVSCTLPNVFIKDNDSTPSGIQEFNPHKMIEKLAIGHRPTHWLPLYNSDSHGLSINRFQHHVFEYNGPTLVFITTENEMFCVANDRHWRDSKHFFGDYESMCIQLTPEYHVVERGANMMYLNLTSRGFPMGFQVGKDNTSRSITIDKGLTMVHYKKIPYKLASIEVWGCGSQNIVEQQKEVKKSAVHDVENRRKINMNTTDWADNPDRYLLELGGRRTNYARAEDKQPLHKLENN